MNNLYFNGKDLWNDFNCGILKGIQYPVVKEIIENIQVEGNIHGNLTEKTGSYGDLIQEVNVRMFGLDNYRMRIAFIEDWLSNIEDKRLFFKENLGRCLYVKNAYISSNYNKNGNNCVEFSLKFECEPFYFDSNIRTVTWNKDTILKSDTMIDYEPIIELQATGVKTTIIINDKELFNSYILNNNVETNNIDVEVPTLDKVSLNDYIVNDITPVNRNGHARRYVNLIDKKYGINGFYITDPTWDNDLENDYYNHMLLTDRESTQTSRYEWNNIMSIFDINNIDEYLEIIKREFQNKDYKEFCSYLKEIIKVIEKLDKIFYSELLNKNNYIDKYINEWPDDVTNLVNDLGKYIVLHVNKPLT